MSLTTIVTPNCVSHQLAEMPVFNVDLVSESCFAVDAFIEVTYAE